MAFILYGARIGIRATDADTLKLVLPGLPPGWRSSAAREIDWLFSVARHGVARPVYTLDSNAERILGTTSRWRLAKGLEREVQLAVAQAARGKLFVHAGVVGWRGRAILIPARSFSGKSTLVRELVRAGATYYSDEYAVLDPQGRVHPFARPLALRDEHMQSRPLSFRALGGKIGVKPLSVALVVSTKYRENARWKPVSLSPGQGVLELLANTVTARTRQKEALETLAQVMRRATALKGARGEAADLAVWLLAAAEQAAFNSAMRGDRRTRNP